MDWSDLEAFLVLGHFLALMGLHCLKAPTCPMTLTQEISVCRWHTDQEKMSLESDFLVVSRGVPEGLLEAELLSVTRVSCQGLL